MATYREAMRAYARQFLTAALGAHGGSRARTAATLGLNRTYLFSLMRQHGLDVEVPSPQRCGVCDEPGHNARRHGP